MKIETCIPYPIQFFVDTTSQIRNSLSRFFSVLTAIQKDGSATMQLLKVGRYAIFAFRAYYGKNLSESVAFRDFDTTLNLLEGFQFVGVINSLLPVKKEGNIDDDQTKPSLFERVSSAAFGVSDIFQSAVWLISKGIPLLGAYSESALLSLEIVSLATALIASIADGVSTTKTIVEYWKVSVPDKTSAIWKLAERITGIASIIIILSGAGGAFVSVAAGLAAASAFCSLVRFVIKLNPPMKTIQT